MAFGCLGFFKNFKLSSADWVQRVILSHFVAEKQGFFKF